MRNSSLCARVHRVAGLLCNLLIALDLGAPNASAQAQNQWPPDAWYGTTPAVARMRNMENERAKEIAITEWVGEPKSVHGSQGKVVVLHFWSQWCPYSLRPCLAGDVDLARRYAAKGVEVIPIHGTDPTGWPKAKDDARHLGVSFSHGHDDKNSTFDDYGVVEISTYVVIDRNGMVRAAGVRFDRVEDVVKHLLAESRAPVRQLEFPPDFYLGGARRPAGLQAMESRSAPPLEAALWIGGPVNVGGGSNMIVAQFFTRTDRASMRALEALLAKRAEFAAIGVTLIGIADPESNREEWLQAQAKEWGIPLMLDRPLVPEQLAGSTAPESRASGQTARAYSAAFYCPTAVIDRRGIVRAMGLRKEHVSDVVAHIALNSEPRPFQPSTPSSGTSK